MIGRVYTCLGDLAQAEASFATAFQLSPCYAAVAYDLAVVRAQQGKGPGSMEALRAAIQLSPLYWYLPQRQRAFMPVEKELRDLLVRVRDEAREAARAALDDAVQALNKVRLEVVELTAVCSGWQRFTVLNENKRTVKSIAQQFTQLTEQCQKTEQDIASSDYQQILEAGDVARSVNRTALTMNGQLREVSNRLEMDLANGRVIGCIVLFLAALAFAVPLLALFGTRN